MINLLYFIVTLTHVRFLRMIFFLSPNSRLSGIYLFFITGEVFFTFFSFKKKINSRFYFFLLYNTAARNFNNYYIV